jgi:hypothetical protein
MAKLKVPSLQHLARIWQPNPERIQRVLVRLTQSGPNFSYEPLFDLVRDMILLRVPYDQIVEGVKRGTKQETVRQNFLGLLPLIRDYFEGVEPTFVQAVAQRLYPVGRELAVPFRPPLIYGASGRLHFPWFSFWRSNPLAAERLSLFASIVDDLLLQDSDLEGANFEVLDFSAPVPGAGRELRVIQASSIPRLSEERKIEMLAVFAEGFRLAREEIANNVIVEHDNDDDIQRDTNQLGLFQ